MKCLEGKKKIDIAKGFSMNHCIITKIIKWFDKYGTVKMEPRTGKLLKPTEKLDRRITRVSKSNPFYIASKIRNQLGLGNISSRTLSCRLDKNNLFFTQSMQETTCVKEK